MEGFVEISTWWFDYILLVNQAIKIGLNSEQQFNDLELKKEVELALKSVGFI